MSVACLTACMPTAAISVAQVRAGDYMSKIAVQFGIDITNFMLDNTDNVKDLDAPLNGKQLLVCNPKTGEDNYSLYLSAVQRPGHGVAPLDRQLLGVQHHSRAGH